MRYDAIPYLLVCLCLGFSCSDAGPPAHTADVDVQDVADTSHDLVELPQEEPEPEKKVEEEDDKKSKKKKKRKKRKKKKKPDFEATVDFNESYHPFLDGEDPQASVSLGTSTDGTLINGQILPLPGQHYRVLSTTSKQELFYGTRELLEFIDQTAETFYQLSDSKRLFVGNLSQRGGGDIKHSVSHNSGRDVDLGFCYRNPRGKPYRAKQLIPVDRRGNSVWGGGHKFDVPCTWSIIKALMLADTAKIQYIFIAEPLRFMLIEHAKKIDEPKELIRRSRVLLLQPPKGASHNDHMHVRIFCSDKDIEHGCVNDGSKQIEARAEYLKPRVETLVHTLTGTAPEPEKSVGKKPLEVQEEQPEETEGTEEPPEVVEETPPPSEQVPETTPDLRIRILKRLVLLRQHQHADIIAKIVAEDSDPDVRIAAAQALGALKSRTQRSFLLARFKEETDGRVQAAILKTLGQLGGREAAMLVASLLGDPKSNTIDAGPFPEMIRVCYTIPEGGKRRKRAMAPPNSPHYCGQDLELSTRKYTLQVAAIEVAADIERPEPVEALMILLRHPDALIRGRTVRALRRLTNHSTKVAWDNPHLNKRAHKRGLESWEKWWKRHEENHRRTWISAGFRAQDFIVGTLEKRYTWELIRAINHEEHLSYNAQRTLMRMAEHEPVSLTWSKHIAMRYWTRYFAARRGTFGLRPCPAMDNEYCPE